MATMIANQAHPFIGSSAATGDLRCPVVRSDATCYWKDMWQKLNRMRQMWQLCDVTLCSADNQMYMAHSPVLAASSERLQSYFVDRRCTAEGTRAAAPAIDRFTLPVDVPADVLQVTLDFIYGVTPTTRDAFEKLRLGASRLRIKGADEYCRRHLGDAMDAADDDRFEGGRDALLETSDAEAELSVVLIQQQLESLSGELRYSNCSRTAPEIAEHGVRTDVQSAATTAIRPKALPIDAGNILMGEQWQPNVTLFPPEKMTQMCGDLVPPSDDIHTAIMTRMSLNDLTQPLECPHLKRITGSTALDAGDVCTPAYDDYDNSSPGEYMELAGTPIAEIDCDDLSSDIVPFKKRKRIRNFSDISNSYSVLCNTNANQNLNETLDNIDKVIDTETSEESTSVMEGKYSIFSRKISVNQNRNEQASSMVSSLENGPLDVMDGLFAAFPGEPLQSQSEARASEVAEKLEAIESLEEHENVGSRCPYLNASVEYTDATIMAAQQSSIKSQGQVTANLESSRCPFLSTSSTSSNAEELIGEHLMSSGNQLVCSGSHLVSSCNQLVCSGSHLVSSGNQLVCSGSQLVSSGSHLVSSDNQLACGGSHLVISDNQLVCSGSSLVSSGNQLMCTGSQLVCSGSQLMSTGSQFVCSGSHVVSSGSHLASSGNPLVYGGSQLVSSGSHLVSSGNPLKCTGSQLVSDGNQLACSDSHVVSNGKHPVYSGSNTASCNNQTVNSCNNFQGSYNNIVSTINNFTSNGNYIASNGNYLVSSRNHPASSSHLASDESHLASSGSHLASGGSHLTNNTAIIDKNHLLACSSATRIANGQLKDEALITTSVGHLSFQRDFPSNTASFGGPLAGASIYRSTSVGQLVDCLVNNGSPFASNTSRFTMESRNHFKSSGGHLVNSSCDLENGAGQNVDNSGSCLANHEEVLLGNFQGIENRSLNYMGKCVGTSSINVSNGISLNGNNIPFINSHGCSFGLTNADPADTKSQLLHRSSERLTTSSCSTGDGFAVATPSNPGVWNASNLNDITMMKDDDCRLLNRMLFDESNRVSNESSEFYRSTSILMGGEQFGSLSSLGGCSSPRQDASGNYQVVGGASMAGALKPVDLNSSGFPTVATLNVGMMSANSICTDNVSTSPVVDVCGSTNTDGTKQCQICLKRCRTDR